MGRDALRATSRWLIMGAAAACAHPLPGPPPSPRAVAFTRHYLPEKPSAILGDQQNLRADLWCAPDHAFAIPVIPYFTGPTEIQDLYGAGGVSNSMRMFDAKQTVLEVLRERDQSQSGTAQVLARRWEKLNYTNYLTPQIRNEWIQQDGITQIQTVNPMSTYQERADAIYFAVSRGGTANGGCRVDRHLAGAGYRFQIIAAVIQPERSTDAGVIGIPESQGDACAIALEMAAWAAQNIRIGHKCAPDSAKSADGN